MGRAATILASPTGRFVAVVWPASRGFAIVRVRVAGSQGGDEEDRRRAGEDSAREVRRGACLSFAWTADADAALNEEEQKEKKKEKDSNASCLVVRERFAILEPGRPVQVRLTMQQIAAMKKAAEARGGDWAVGGLSTCIYIHVIYIYIYIFFSPLTSHAFLLHCLPSVPRPRPALVRDPSPQRDTR